MCGTGIQGGIAGSRPEGLAQTGWTSEEAYAVSIVNATSRGTDY